MVEIKERNADEVMLELRVAASSLFTLANATVAEVGMAMGGDSALSEAGRFNSEVINDDALLLKWYKLNKHSVGDKMVEAVYDITGEYLLLKGLIGEKLELKAHNGNSVCDRFTDPAEFYRHSGSKELSGHDLKLFLMSMVGMVDAGRVEEVLAQDLRLLLSNEADILDVLEWNEATKAQVVTNLELRNVAQPDLF